jgi:hypothetical protein
VLTARSRLRKSDYGGFRVLVAGKKSEKDGILDAQDVEIEEVGVSASTTVRAGI